MFYQKNYQLLCGRTDFYKTECSAAAYVLLAELQMYQLSCGHKDHIKTE